MGKIKKKRLWKGVILAVLITGILFSALSLYLKHNYKDMMIGLITKEVERHVIPNVYTEIDFTLWRTFPNASVVFSDIRVADPLVEDAFMFESENIYFSFNVLDIIRGNYRLTSMTVTDASLSLMVHEDGRANYDHVLYPSPDTTVVDLEVNLDNIRLRNMDIAWKDDKNRQEAILTLNHIRAQGQFSATEFTMSTQGELVLHSITDKGYTWANEDLIAIDLQTDISHKEKTVNIAEGLISFNSLSMELEGMAGFGADPLADLTLYAPAVDLARLIEDLPQKYTAPAHPYSIQGTGEAKAWIKGNYTQMPAIRAQFALTNGKMKHKSSGVAIEKLTMNGAFSNGKQKTAASSVVQIEQFQGRLEGQKFSGNLKASQLNQPAIQLYTKATLDIEKVKTFMELDALKAAKGQVKADLDFAFQPNDIFDLQPEDFRDSRANGTVILSDNSIKIKGSQLEGSNLNGEISFNNRDVTVKRLSGYLNESSDFAISGRLYNLLPFLLFTGQNLHIAADFRSENLQIDDLLRPQDYQHDQKEAYYLELPYHISFNFAMEADKVAFRKFRGQNVQGNARMKNQVLYFSQMKMNSMDGEVVGKGTVSAREGQKVHVNGEAFLHKVQMDQALYQLENLNQDDLTHENLSGRLTGDFHFSARFTRTLQPIPKSFVAQADIIVENGQLKKFEPLQRMARFLNIPELEMVEFETLKNTISLKDMVITIPQMDVKSNAGNMKVRGSHTLENEVEYYVEMLLSQLLEGVRGRDSKPEHSEFGEIRDEGGFTGLKLFLKVHGPVNNPRFSYDAKGLATEVQEGIRAQRQSVRQSLHDELGLFRGDTTLDHREKSERRSEREQRREQREEERRRLEKREQGEFIIEWEED